MSGSKWLMLLLPAIFLAACSPKIRPVVVQQPATKTQEEVTKEKEAAEKAAAAKAAAEVPVVKPKRIPSIALLLPFALDPADPKTVTKNQVKTNIAVDFYEGFKLALDSLTSSGQSFKLTVLDTRDEESQAQRLAADPAVRNSDLVVGPIFPAGVQAFSARISNLHKPVVSPLSATSPAGYHNESLITLTPPLEFHAWRVAQYIQENIRPKVVYILRSGFSEENKYILPFKRSIDSLSHKRIRIVDVTISKGNFSALLPSLSKTSENVFVMPATDRSFLRVMFQALDKLADTYPIQLFGHPNWNKATFLRQEVLEKMHTCITSAYQVNYKSAETSNFIKSFRRTYHTEPGEYAIKGFDTGLYFGKLVADPAADFNHLQNMPFDALHNHFEFVKKKGYGWINTYVELLQYEDYTLKPVK
ncbi:ABC transporter substrate-binding protein [Mucilaginibacter arboris]|uniref:ABC transporter substrate-binding protein n=1 Tax=Mucilaginibacter arboris TaxID=2682090 RepID=UPI0018DB510B|nr:ABC transporter substrate-binding protein [Mucilaginibacter arboris]